MSHCHYDIYNEKYIFFCSLNSLSIAFLNIKFTLTATELRINISEI